ncbi:MAG: glycolate oxidase subunit GlcF [Rhodocyclaceae bacterium]|jgi:glycolate oxidase iron-sulfur subunit|nr:glycolate oxidase subunit GlcF [Rhodocyclaceae bacterium]
METHLADFIRDTTAGREAEEILRKCVHCGFCTATCPTYQLLGDELDGPRGRIYLIKQVLEGATPTEKTRLHLDRCLTCRSCETTCPSGVHYSRLLDIGRAVVEARVPRSGTDRLLRGALRAALPRPALFGVAMRMGQMVRPLLPGALKAKVPPLSSAGTLPAAGVRTRRMLVLAGCAQPSMYPNINGAAMRLLARLGIDLFEAPEAGCCGAVKLHLNDAAGAMDNARRNIDAWWPHIEAGVEAIVMTASGCGVQVKDYGHLLQEDPAYAAKAARVGELTRDVSEVVAGELDALAGLLEKSAPAGRRVLSFQSPCTLQHGLKLRGVVEQLLAAAGFDLMPVADAHLCCGSAGTYSILQPELSLQLRDNKLAALSGSGAAGSPQGIASANIGCIAHLQSGTALPVKHWIEWLEERLTA